MPLEVWTVGHSNHDATTFRALLQAWRIEAVADVRRFPGSRRHPHFGSEALAADLEDCGIGYAWLGRLGGRRRSATEAADSAWRNPSFRAYADHLASEEFAGGLEELLHMAQACRTAIMCSELLWWRCHRALISDVLRFSGVDVIHILGVGKGSPHPWTAPARIVDGELNYTLDAGALPCRDC
jgi:uncharacterized protein (DUF488 family)